MSTHHYIACDLGAESGRVILGRLQAGKLSLEEVHRFPNEPVRLDGSLRWNVLRLWEEIKTGLRKVAPTGVPVESLSVDSWGVDYALLGGGQSLLATPHHYRDPRSEAPFAAAMQDPGADFIFAETGIQMMAINTLYQLMAELERSPRLLALAEQFLNIADFFHYLLSGRICAEESLASTTQLYDPRSRAWSQPLLARFHLPTHLFPPIVPPGTVLGPLQDTVRVETGLAEQVRVVASCSHDTGAAVAAVPARPEEQWAFLSSGTWSLIGVELPSPNMSAQARTFNFTNEAGYGGTTRFLKNIVGLWILQEVRREWAAQGLPAEYGALSQAAEQAPAFGSLIDPADPRFAKPGDMLAKITAYCTERGAAAPTSQGAVVRCIYESLSLLYHQTLQDLESITDRSIRVLHIVGGGSQSTFFNQCVANATGRVVHAGPVEATAAGNILIQSLALGHLGSIAELRATVRASFEVREFQPANGAAWAQAFERFKQLRAR